MEEESKNQLDKLAEFYSDSVDKADKAGFAETYKTATELLFKRICEELNTELHFEDVEYLDGYFIFGMGTNSVVHFRIKEAPGWLGGIWWEPIATDDTKDLDEDKREYVKDRLGCNLFFQFEKEIDKFKPSASTFGGDDFDFYLEEGHGNGTFFRTCMDLEFIIKEPYLAFYREITYTDFNHEYVSREKAKRFWDRHWREKEKAARIKDECAKKFMDMVKYVVRPTAEDGDLFILDHGANTSPRYDIIVKNVTLPDGKPLVDEPGCYPFFGWGWEDEAADKKLWNKTKRECAKRMKSNFYYGCPCHDSMSIMNPDGYDEFLHEMTEHDKVLFGKTPDGQFIDKEAEASGW